MFGGDGKYVFLSKIDWNVRKIGHYQIGKCNCRDVYFCDDLVSQIRLFRLAVEPNMEKSENDETEELTCM